MLFNSFEFAVFFPVVALIYFWLPLRWRWAWLLLASCVFYMFAIPVYILVLGFTILVDYVAGIWIEQSQGKRRKWLLACSIAANIGILAYFKYYNFFLENIMELVGSTPETFPLERLSWALPVGLSFHTFQAMSYTIEVYMGKQKAEHHAGIYALYVMFFPQLVAGPIERPQNILHQLRQKHDFDFDRARSGLVLMAWGLFKKVVIADRLAEVVNLVYNHPTNFEGLPLMVATVFFSIQIYCDFSGYSDMAIGGARLLGIDLMKNFNAPYLAQSFSSFWRRWHISLSTWFRDYVYIPLGGNQLGESRKMFNLFVVFTLSGFWHGANWNFMVWGLLHWGFLLSETWIQSAFPSLKKQVHPVLKTLIVFVLANVAWVFFRANHVGDALYILSHFHLGLFEKIMHLNENIHDGFFDKFLGLPGSGLSLFDWAMIPISIAILFVADLWLDKNKFKDFSQFTAQLSAKQRRLVYFSLTAVILICGRFSDLSFIYFQF